MASSASPEPALGQQEPNSPIFDSARHVRYWLRCFRSFLPHQYTSNDSTRVTLAFFIISALDLLSSASSFSTTPATNVEADKLSLLKPADRVRLRKWILSLQHPNGGFCGSPHHVLPVNDPKDHVNANIAATVFALLSLGILSDLDGKDAFLGVERIATLRWLKKLQREDGSFGEMITRDGYIGGGRDTRYCYIAAIIRFILCGVEARWGDENLDFDVDALVGHIRRGQTFDGGIAESSMHESHAGYAYCAIACLSVLDYSNTDPTKAKDHYIHAGIPSKDALLRWLVDRQLLYLDSSEDDEDEGDDSNPIPDLATLSLLDPLQAPIGFNGRPNKLADSCYSWWVTGSLHLLEASKLVDSEPARRFILEKTQHIIGGFSKSPGGPPDMYHAYFGLGALSTMAKNNREEGLGWFDYRLSVSEEAGERIEKGREIFTRKYERDPDLDAWELTKESDEDMFDMLSKYMKPPNASTGIVN
jgi:geranylgeranyl transferase type-1 subunit beta